MANNDINLDNELSPEEQALGERIRQATNYKLPTQLAARIERDMATTLIPAPNTKRNFLNSWRLVSLATLILLAIGFSLGLSVILRQNQTVSAAEISTRIDQTLRKNLQDGTIVHRTYSIFSSYLGRSSNGTHEEWAQVLATGEVTKYKAVQLSTINGVSDKGVSLYLKDQHINEFWEQSTNTIYSSDIGNFQPHLNPLQDVEQLFGYSQASSSGTINYYATNVEQSDPVYYKVQFYEEATTSSGQKFYERVDFYVNKQNYEVNKLEIHNLQSKDGPEGSNFYQAILTSAELIPPNPTISNQIFVLGAPSDAKRVG